jgi:hypothetical protein
MNVAGVRFSGRDDRVWLSKFLFLAAGFFLIPGESCPLLLGVAVKYFGSDVFNAGAKSHHRESFLSSLYHNQGWK